MKTDNDGNAAVEHFGFESGLIDDGRAGRLCPKTLDEMQSARQNMGHMAELHSLDELKRLRRFEPDLVEVISARHEIRDAMFPGVAGVNDLSCLRRGGDRVIEAADGDVDWPRPDNGHL